MGKTIDEVKVNYNKLNDAWISDGFFGDNIAFSKLFSGSKGNIITPELLGDFEAFKDLFNESKLSAGDLGGVNQRIVDYASTCKNGDLSTTKFAKSLENLTLGVKAANIAMKALTIAGNIAIMLAVTKGIELAAKAIDNYVHRAEKARESFRRISIHL